MDSYQDQIYTLNTETIHIKKIFISVKKWIFYFKTKILSILIFAFLAGGLSYWYVSLKEPFYKADCTFALEDDNSRNGLGGLGGLASMLGADFGGQSSGIFQGDNLLQLYRSRSMVQKALMSYVNVNGKPILLVNLYISFNNLKSKWLKSPLLRDLTFNSPAQPLPRLQDSVLSVFVNDINKNYLTVDKLDKKMSIIQVSVVSKDENFSKFFNDRIVATVNDFYIQTKTKKSLQNVALLQHQTDSVKNILNNSMMHAAAVNDQNTNLNPSRQILRMPAQRSQLNAEVDKTLLAQLIQNLEISKLSLRKETPLIQLIDQPIFPLQVINTNKIKAFLIGFVLMFVLITGALTIKHMLQEA